MKILSREKVEQLSLLHLPHCISIYIPTHRAGVEVNEGLDLINFKNQIKEVKHQLAKYQLTESEIKNVLSPARTLIEDLTFWHNLSEGLVVFIGQGVFEYYQVPVSFQERVYIADHFYMLPLLKLFSLDKGYFVLALSKHMARLYEGNLYSFKEVELDRPLPSRVEEVVGYDFEEPFHNRNRKLNGSMGKKGQFKGHGEGENENKEKREVEQFCLEVDHGLHPVLSTRKAPLVLVTEEYLFPIFKGVNKSQNLINDFVQGSPDHLSMSEMHRKTMEVAQSHFMKIQEQRNSDYNELVEKTSYTLEEIIPAAVIGRVDTLFVKENETRWGQFDQESNQVELQDEQELNNACMLNLAAMNVFNQGGEVILKKAEEMPAINSLLNAIYRY